MHSLKLLERVPSEHTLLTPARADEFARVALKPPRDIAPDSLQNPSDPDAGYCAHKGKGYQVQVMETYTEETDPEKKSQHLDLITHVAVESAHHHVIRMHCFLLSMSSALNGVIAIAGAQVLRPRCRPTTGSPVLSSCRFGGSRLCNSVRC